MKDEIESRFLSNLARVSALVDLYEQQGTRRARAVPASSDLLRATVVVLHATLEDLLRSALDWKLASAAAEHLAEVPLAGCAKRGREPWFDLADLAQHRGKTIDAVLSESVSEHLQDSSFNHPGQVEEVLKKLRVDPSIALARQRSKLGALMARRHWIVHRVDREDNIGSRGNRVRTISTRTVRRWFSGVQAFGGGVPRSALMIIGRTR